MEKVIERHADKIIGTLSCLDRILFRGYLPIMTSTARALYLKIQGVRRETVKVFVLDQAARLKAHALAWCTRTGRPYEYLGNVVGKEEMARKIAELDRVKQGLACVLSLVEPAGPSRWLGMGVRRRSGMPDASACSSTTTTSWTATLRHRLPRTSYPITSKVDKRPGLLTRLLRRLHARRLVAKIPHSRRWRMSLDGHRTMATAIRLREVAHPSLFAAAA